MENKHAVHSDMVVDLFGNAESLAYHARIPLVRRTVEALSGTAFASVLAHCIVSRGTFYRNLGWQDSRGNMGSMSSFASQPLHILSVKHFILLMPVSKCPIPSWLSVHPPTSASRW